MGKVDIRVKNFIKVDTVFAQLFSEGVFKGSAKIDPNKLQELDTANQTTLKDLERLRDVQKITMLYDDKLAFQIILGVEGQTGVHYYMPVRCMELDALSYSGQCRRIAEKAIEDKKLKKYADGVPKGTKIVPTVTLVFYVGSKPWDGPRSIHDMLDIPEDKKEWAKRFIPEYQMYLIDARHLTEEEINRFNGDLKAFLLIITFTFIAAISSDAIFLIVSHSEVSSLFNCTFSPFNARMLSSSDFICCMISCSALSFASEF